MGAAEDIIQLQPDNAEIEMIDRQLGEGKYRNIRRFKEGGTRHLYIAEWGPAEETVIIKVDKQESKLDSPRAQRHVGRGYNTNNEISMLALMRKLEAPEKHHIQRIYDFNADCTISVEPMFNSESLEEMVERNGPLSAKDFKTVFTQILEASRYMMQDVEIVHRDLKPSNILVSKDKKDGLEVRVVDFANGCPKDKTETKMMPTAGGHFIMDPHIIGQFNLSDNGHYTDKSEMYALGAGMLLALTGEYAVEYEPDKGFAVSTMTGENLLGANGKLDAAAHDGAVDAFLAKNLPRHTRKYKKIIKKCLTLDDNKRYKSIDNLVRDFEKVNTPKAPALISAGIVLAIGAAILGGFGLAYYQNRLGDERAVALRQHTRDEDTRLRYKNMFRDAYSFVEQSIIDGRTKNDMVFEYPYSMLTEQEEIVNTAKRHGVDPDLVANILIINNAYAGDSASELASSPVYLFDPITTRRNMYSSYLSGMYDSSKRQPSGSPAKILDEGVARLAGLIHKNNGNLEKALTEFYSPVYPPSERSSHDRWWIHGTYSDEISEVVDQEICIIVHNVVKGPFADPQVGAYYIETFACDYLNKRYGPLRL